MATLSSTAPKATLAYRVISGYNPQQPTQSILRPLIVNKETYDTGRVLHYALDNGYVLGTQFYAGFGIVNGFLEACQALGKDGRDILLNSWLRIHPELRGTCDPETRQIGADNELHVCVQAQLDLRRKATDFNWTCVDDNAARPTVQHLQSEGSTRDKVIWASARIMVGGTNLIYTASTDKITASWNTVDETTGVVTPHEAILVPESSSSTNMVLPFPSGLATAAIGTAVTFTFLLKQGNENATVLPATCKAILVANPTPPTAPTITSVQQEGKPVNTVKFSTAVNFVINGTNLGQTGDQVKLELVDAEGEFVDDGDCTAKVVSATSTQITMSGLTWQGRVPDGDWMDAYPRSKIVLVRGTTTVKFPVTFTNS